MIRQTGDAEEQEKDPESDAEVAVELRDDMAEAEDEDIDPAELWGPEECGIRRQTITTDP